MSYGSHLGKDSKPPVLPKDGKLHLYSMRFCPYAQRVHLVLDAKGIPYHTIYINLNEKPDWFIKKSPLGKVPVLEIPTEEGSPIIFESLIICEYLDEKYPEKPLFPKDPLQKAKDKILIEKFNDVISPMYNIIMFGEDKSSKFLQKIEENLATYEDELSHRKTPYFGGDHPGMLDYMIWPWCERSYMLKYLKNKYEINKEKFPKLVEWCSLMKEDEAVKQTFVSGKDHAKFIQTRIEGNPDYDMLIDPCKRQRTL